MRNESNTFLGYKKMCGQTVAEFRKRLLDIDEDGNIRETIVMDKPSCELRLKNLKAGGYPCDQTALALHNWPTNK